MQRIPKNFSGWLFDFMRFSYKAVTADGKRVRGFAEAKEPKDAAYYLRQRNLTPIDISKEKEAALLHKIPFLGGIKAKDLIIFTRQMSSMLTSGLTVVKSLEILKDQVSNKAFAEIIRGVLLDIEEGKSFSDSIAKYPDIFPNVYVSLVKAGETSGLLDKIFLRLANNLEKQQKLKSTVKSALIYPIIVISLMLVVIFIIVIFVVPELNRLYESLNADIPVATKLVVGFSNTITKGWPVILGLGAVLGYAFLRWKKTPRGREIFDRNILRVPLIGKILSLSILTEFSRTLSLLVGTGTLVVDALEQSAKVTGNATYERSVINIARRVEKGISVGESMASMPYFPSILIQLVKVGEETGKLDENLMKASTYFEDEVNQSVKNLTTIMEPLILVVLGLGVGFLVFSVITPIYNLLSSIQ